MRRTHPLVLLSLALLSRCDLARHAAERLVVNGETIPEAAIRRELVYRLGAGELDARVRELLRGRTDVAVETAVHGLAPRSCARVGGTAVETDALYKLVRARVTPEEERRARLWLAKTTAVRQALERDGDIPADAELRAAYAAHARTYAGSPFSLEMLALDFKGFPALDTYELYFRLHEAFARRSAPELTDANLAAHLARTDRLLGLAEVDCQVILCSAYDFERERWSDGGWKSAQARAQAAVAALAAGEPWDAVLEQHSDFDALPVPARDSMRSLTRARNGGRFGPLNRNSLGLALGESVYAEFLLGASLTDRLFFDQEVGGSDGPFRGPHGFYVARVDARSGPKYATPRLSDPTQRQMIEQDYLTQRFHAFARESLERAVVKGLEP